VNDAIGKRHGAFVMSDKQNSATVCSELLQMTEDGVGALSVEIIR